MLKLVKRCFCCAVPVIGLCLIGSPLYAQNKYDVLARVLQPYGALFYSKAAIKALQAKVILRQGPEAAAQFLNQPVQISFQIPDKLRLETLDPEHRIVFCRDGQRVWAYPREFAIKIAGSSEPLNADTRIPDFRLPLKDNEIVLMPALFQVLRFKPSSDWEGNPAWNLQVRLAPEVSQALKSDPWTASALVKRDDCQVRQLKIEGPSWSGTVDVLSTHFTKMLPAETWQTDPVLAAEATEIPPALFSSVLEKLSTASSR